MKNEKIIFIIFNFSTNVQSVLKLKINNILNNNKYFFIFHEHLNIMNISVSQFTDMLRWTFFVWCVWEWFVGNSLQKFV